MTVRTATCRTGSVFGVQARFPRERAMSSGLSSRHVRVADSGNRITSEFCPACGSTVSYRSDAEPDLIAVPVGAFADSQFPAPTISVYETRRHPWVDVPPAIEHFD